MFVYSALNTAGDRVQDTLEAENESEAQRLLCERRLFVLSLTSRGAGRRQAAERRTGAARSPGGARARVSRRVVTLFARQMAMMLRAGAPVVSAIQAVSEQTTHREMRRVLAGLSRAVEQGCSLNEAMSRYPELFDGIVRSVVAAGEATGALSPAFDRLAMLMESAQKVRGKVLSALIYPAFLMLLTLGLVFTLVLFVLPRFADLFSMLGAELPSITVVMLGCGQFGKDYWPGLLAGAATAIVLLIVCVRSGPGRSAIEGVIFHAPVLGTILRSVILARFLRVWGTLLCAKVPLLEAIRYARETTSQRDFQALFGSIDEAVNQGRPLSAVLKSAWFVPATVSTTVATGEASGRLGESIEFVASWMEESNEARIAAVTRIIEPAILLFMGLLVGGISIALFLPLFDVATAA